MYFSDKRYPALQSIVILDPQWISDVMSKFTSSSLKGTSITHTESLVAVADRFKEFPEPLQFPILQLLLKFGIGYLLNPLGQELSSQQNHRILIPSLLGTDLRYNTIIQHWPTKYDDTYIEQGRIYRFNFWPVGLFKEIVQSVLHLPFITVDLLWRNGVIINYNSQEALESSHSLPQQRAYITRSSNMEICIRVRTPKAQRYGRLILLRAIMDVVETHVESIDTDVKRYVPCSHCIDKRNSDNTAKHYKCTDLLGSTSDGGIFEFTFQECIQTLLKGDRSLWCNHIKSPSRRVRLVELAPDLSYSNIPSIRNNQIQMQEVLGSGSFGTVSKALLSIPGSESLITVAVKKLTSDEFANVSLFLEFYDEVEIMAMISHPNLVNLSGITLVPELQIVMEYVPLGDLFGLLHPTQESNVPNSISKIPNEEFPWRERLLIALDIAKGMNVLQSHSPPIVHRDLRSANIFVQSRSLNPYEVRVKVADFGLSRVVPVEMKGILETWKWLAPEVITPGCRYGTASDVYSFAIVCWEIATRSFPFDEFYQHPFYSYSTADLQTRLLNEEKIKSAIIDDDLRPSLDSLREYSDCSDEDNMAKGTFAKIISMCWVTEPHERPNFASVIEILLAALDIDVIRDSRIIQNDSGCRSSQLMKKNSVSSGSGNLGVTVDDGAKNVFVLDRTVFVKESEEVQYSVATVLTRPMGGSVKEYLWIGSSFGMLSVFQLNTVSIFHILY